MHAAQSLQTARIVVARARETQLSVLAASLAYYMLVSVFPLGLLAFVLGQAVGGEQFATTLLASVSTFLSPAGATLLDEALRASTGRGGVTVLGVGLLLWSGLRIFRGLDVAFTLAYGRDDVGSIPERFLDATVALLGIAIAVLSLMAVNAVLAASGVVLTGLAGTLLLVCALSVAFYPFYYLFPDVELTYREAVPGTLLAAVGWTALGATFTIYAANAGSFALYGAIGAVLLLVTWFYVAGLVLLLGAVLNAVLAETDGGDRQRQGAPARSRHTMSDDGGARSGRATDDSGDPADGRSIGGDEAAAGGADRDDVEQLREELAALREEVDEKSLPREELEGELRRYVRARVRRGHARGWGPYLVLLYGTAMTLGAFYFLSGLVAILAMFVVWLSTLGMYTLMLLAGATTGAITLPGRVIDRVRDFRR